MSVSAGEQVIKGQRVAVIEAMKMEHALIAPFDGEVGAVHAAAGDQVGEGALLLEITPEAES
jgi:3-methylcrotonyl-CoA carboxylase alpha subunit